MDLRFNSYADQVRIPDNVHPIQNNTNGLVILYRFIRSYIYMDILKKIKISPMNMLLFFTITMMENAEVIDTMFNNLDSFLASSYVLSNVFKPEHLDEPYTFSWCTVVVISRVLLMICFLCMLIGVVRLI